MNATTLANIIDSITSFDHPDHPNKVFISDVFAEVKNNLNETLAEFKILLMQAAQQELLTISRCDLVAAFDMDKIQESECHQIIGGIDTGITFHFLNI